jgi:hypothetical protein
LVDIDFTAFLIPFFREFEYFSWSVQYIRYLYLPILYLVDKVSNLNMNFAEVTCTGAQTPLYLLIDLLIVVVVVVVIESDVLVFWIMMVAPTMGKIRSMVFNRHYFSRNILSSTIFLMIAIFILLLPDPSKLIQYTMGFIEFMRLFNTTGYTAHWDWVSVSQNCNGSISIGLIKIPMDSILANFTGIATVCLLPVGESFCFKSISLISFNFIIHLLSRHLCAIDCALSEKYRTTWRECRER